MLERLVLEGIDREAGDYPSEGETLKDWLPESVIKEMEAQARRGGRLPPDLAETVFGGELVKNRAWRCAQRPYDDVRDEITHCRASGRDQRRLSRAFVWLTPAASREREHLS